MPSEDTRSAAPAATLLTRWTFDGRTFRAVLRYSGIDVLEILDGVDAMGVERWNAPPDEVNEELCEDIAGLVGAAIRAALAGGEASP